MPAGATDYENAMIPWEDVKAFAEFTPPRRRTTPGPRKTTRPC